MKARQQKNSYTRLYRFPHPDTHIRRGARSRSIVHIPIMGELSSIDRDDWEYGKGRRRSSGGDLSIYQWIIGSNCSDGISHRHQADWRDIRLYWRITTSFFFFLTSSSITRWQYGKDIYSSNTHTSFYVVTCVSWFFFFFSFFSFFHDLFASGAVRASGSIQQQNNSSTQVWPGIKRNSKVECIIYLTEEALFSLDGSQKEAITSLNQFYFRKKKD